MRFLIDVDEVLTNFVERLTPIVSGLLGREWHSSELPPDEWDMFTVLSDAQRDALCALMERPGFCSQFKVAPGAVEAVIQLRQYCEVYAVTAPNYFPNWCNERTRWLEQHFGFKPHQVVHTHAKHLVKGDFFLDDRPEHVGAWTEEQDGSAMLWTTPHNRRTKGYDVFRVYGWDDVIRVVRSEIEAA